MFGIQDSQRPSLNLQRNEKRPSEFLSLRRASVRLARDSLPFVPTPRPSAGTVEFPREGGTRGLIAPSIRRSNNAPGDRGHAV